MQFAGEWGRGGWLKSGGQFGATSSLTTTLTGTTVGGTARLDGAAEKPLTGTFDGTLFTGGFFSTVAYTLDLTLTGGFLVGPYKGGIVDGIATFVTDAAPEAPALPPAGLSGTWKSSTTAATGAFVVTTTATTPMITGRITAPGLVDEDAFFGYNDRVFQGASTITSVYVMLFGSGTRFVGSYATNTDVGVLDLTVTP